MGYRLSKIYTRTGDKGETGMAGGGRVAKDDNQVIAIGDVDELNSHIGLLITEVTQSQMKEKLQHIQHVLFDLGAQLGMPEYVAVSDTHIKFLETYLDEMNANLTPLDEFILPGGCRSAAQAHVARAVCRRVERSMVALNRQQTLAPEALAYINRLSDLLFVLARQCCADEQVDEVYWKKSLTRSE